MHRQTGEHCVVCMSGRTTEPSISNSTFWMLACVRLRTLILSWWSIRLEHSSHNLYEFADTVG